MWGIVTRPGVNRRGTCYMFMYREKMTSLVECHKHKWQIFKWQISSVMQIKHARWCDRAELFKLAYYKASEGPKGQVFFIYNVKTLWLAPAQEFRFLFLMGWSLWVIMRFFFSSSLIIHWLEVRHRPVDTGQTSKHNFIINKVGWISVRSEGMLTRRWD